MPTSPRSFFNAPAPTIEFPAPEVALLSEEVRGDRRILQLRVSSPRGAALLKIYVDQESEVSGGSLGDLALDDQLSLILCYGFNTEPVELELAVPLDKQLILRIVDSSYGLPEGLYQPRPPEMIATPRMRWFQDVVLVSRAATF